MQYEEHLLLKCLITVIIRLKLSNFQAIVPNRYIQKLLEADQYKGR
jgi:hypothetical protein